ncbi:hypothetical protein L484_001743 [Morus notabilis]|uniref:Micro-fibrillar-associated protein 1 C-terminal domain-containing protein n=1 Tax=Morus notabilis TaxID=981085 RepID=W9RL20_9ROSA|nr:hypothetical protein L484_001743 [Morus notabilis]
MWATVGVSDTVIAIRDKLRAPEWVDDADEDGNIRMARAAALEKAFPTQEDSGIARKDDPRLRCLAESRIDNLIEEETKRQEGLDAEEEYADALEERTCRIKERLRQRVQEEALLLLSEDEEEEEEEEEEESEGMQLQTEERALEELKNKKLEERKKETKQIVVEEIGKDAEIQKRLEQEANSADIDTDDEINEAEEYEAWKVREIARVKRDRED